MSLYTYQASLTRVVDGDTVDVTVDLGFKISYAIRIRLARINAPEISTPEGIAARDYITTLLTPVVMIVTKKDSKDNYGRYLAEITNTTGVDVNQAMLDSGHAVPYP